MRLRQADKLEALDKLCKHLGLLKLDVRPTAPVTNITQVNQIHVDRLTDAELVQARQLLEKMGVGTWQLDQAPDAETVTP